MQAVLILEDNDAKIAGFFMKYSELLNQQTVFVARTVEAAQAFIESEPGLVTIFLDYELSPGCGDGLTFLKWVLKYSLPFIEHVYITTFSALVATEMAELLSVHNIPHERAK